MTLPVLPRSDRPTSSPGRRWLCRVTRTVTATTTGGILLVGAPMLPQAGASGSDAAPVAATAHRRTPAPGRTIVGYRVRPGDTATGLAVRFHAWTAELRALNHLGPHSVLYAGQRIRIPVVPAALRRHRPARRQAAPHAHRRVHRHASRHPARHPAPHPARHPAQDSGRHAGRHPWSQADASRATVRGVVARTARRHRVDPELALAISWQESGWQQRRVSSAGAIGAMQVMPATGRWMSLYAERSLNLYALDDNVTAGVSLVRVLRSQTTTRRTIAAYYQGLGAVQKHGMYPSTKVYVRNVEAIRSRLERGRGPS